MTRDYLLEEKAPRREDVDQMTGPVVLEFGTAWCGYCQAAQRDIATLLAQNPQVKHIKVEDGPGRRLEGRREEAVGLTRTFGGRGLPLPPPSFFPGTSGAKCSGKSSYP